MNSFITEHLPIWTTAQEEPRSGKGRGKKAGPASPYGIKKLRELILELAVRGKLVEQDPNDESASILLGKIINEQKRLVKEEGLRTKAKMEIDPKEEYIGSGRGWEFCRLGNLAKFIDYRGRTPKKNTSGNPLITAKNVRFGFLSRNPQEYISNKEYEIWMTRGFPRNGDILFTTEAPLGNIAIVNIEEKFALAQRVICFQLHVPEIAPFLKVLMMSRSFQKQLTDQSSGMTAKGIKSARLKEIVAPLPPLAEQQRIVAKVDELMALCDQLEQQQTSTIATHQTLVESLLTSLTSAKDQKECAAAWHHLAPHFNTLFTTTPAITLLKQSILQLAIDGQLVKFSDETKYLVKDVLSFGPRNGLSPKEVPYVTDVKVLKLGATTKGFLDLEESKYVDVEVESDSHLWLQADDILIQRGNAAQHVGCNIVLNKTLPNYIYPDLMMKLQVNDLILPKYLSLCLASPSARKFMWDRMTGTSGTMPKISKKVVESIPLIVPNLEIQQTIIALAYQLLVLCDQLQNNLSSQRTTNRHLADTMMTTTLENH